MKKFDHAILHDELFIMVLGTDCPEPSAPINGKVIGSQSTIGSTIRYECSVGHTFTHNAKTHAVCSSNKQWSNPPPRCQSKYISQKPEVLVAH